MSELIQKFSGQTLKEWEEWYLKKHPHAIQKATEKIANMIENFNSVMDKIDQQLIENWVRDLVIIKTFIGLKFQEAILSKASQILKTNYKLASPDEESQGIDGYIGNIPVSIKPETYRSMRRLGEKIEVKLIFYNKVKDGINFDLTELIKK